MPRGNGGALGEHGRRAHIRALMDDLPTPSAETMAGMFGLDKAEVEAFRFIAEAYLPGNHKRDGNDCEGR